LPLEYYGEFTGSYWPRPESDWLATRTGQRKGTVRDRINALGFSPDYFIITYFAEFNKHHADLKDFLAKNCHLVEGNDEYLIYDACS
jgi:hypothetical protein